MLDHVALYVSDLDRSRRFYEQALAPLGYTVVMEMDGFAALGHEGYPRLGLRIGEDASKTTHVAFTAIDRETVDAFHAAATGAGGTDNGPPGVREHYAPTYYAAYVHDPDGNNVEAVCNRPQ